MKKIILPNRDGAKLWLEQFNNSEWRLTVDKKHLYCLEYLRVTGTLSNGKITDIEAIDPSGGPYLSLGEILEGEEDDYYEIVKFINPTTLLLSERDNDN